jgi:hypothetical protein
MLDNSIKQHIVKRNITIYSDIVTGFDTEYLPLDIHENELLSAQLSSTHVLKITVPLFKEYKFEGVNTLTSETYLKVAPKFSNVDLLQEFIKNKIIENRLYKYGEHDKIMNKIILYLKDLKEVKSINITEKSVSFAFDKSKIKNLFILPIEDELLKINFSTLINLITHNCDRGVLENRLLNLLTELDYAQITEDVFEISEKSEAS